MASIGAANPASLRHRSGALPQCQPAARTFASIPAPRAPSLHRGHHRHVRIYTTGDSSGAQTLTAAPASASDPNPAALVDALLALIADSERQGGDTISEERRKEADDVITQLSSIGQGSRPLDNDLIFGNYNVAYVSQGNKQDGQPAGGRFRTGLGRFLFRTTRLCQSVVRPDVVTNKVELQLFGFLPCAVGLRGTLTSIPEAEGGVDNADTVKVFFEPPVLTLPGGIHTRIGPPSSVVLKTTYLDEKVRLGKGSRGSLFVFTRGGESDQADMENVGLQRTTPLGAVMLVAFLGALVVSGGYLAQSAGLPMPVRAGGVLCMLLGAALGGIFARGGIMDRNQNDRPEVERRNGGADASPAPAA